MNFKSLFKSFSSVPWVEYRLNDTKSFISLAYNSAFVNQQEMVQSDIGFSIDRTELEIISVWKNTIVNNLSDKPWSSFDIEDGKITRLLYNTAFVKELRVQLMNHENSTYKTDDEIIELWKARREAEAEEPKLEVIHSGIDANGKIALKLDWNEAFIKHIKNYGFTGETDDEVIHSYMASIARDNAPGDNVEVQDYIQDESSDVNSISIETLKEIDMKLKEPVKTNSKKKKAHRATKTA